MLTPIQTLQQIWKEAPAEPELAMLGDLVEIEFGSVTLTGVVMEGDPWLDDFGRTWFKVSGVVNGRFDKFTASTWVTDNEVIRIIR